MFQSNLAVIYQKNPTNKLPLAIIFLQKHAALGINHPLSILTIALCYISSNIFKQPLNHTKLPFQTLIYKQPESTRRNCKPVPIFLSNSLHCYAVHDPSFLCIETWTMNYFPNTLKFSHILTKSINPITVPHLQKILLHQHNDQTSSGIHVPYDLLLDIKNWWLICPRCGSILDHSSGN